MALLPLLSWALSACEACPPVEQSMVLINPDEELRGLVDVCLENRCEEGPTAPVPDDRPLRPCCRPLCTALLDRVELFPGGVFLEGCRGWQEDEIPFVWLRYRPNRC